VPARYSAVHETAAGTNLTLLEIVNGDGSRRAWIYDIILGSDSLPADFAGQFDLIRGTVSGAGAAISENKLDPVEGSAIMVALGGTFTGQTKTAASAMLSIGLNQRASFRWIAKPGGELVIPATTDAWVGIESVGHGATPSVESTLTWAE